MKTLVLFLMATMFLCTSCVMSGALWGRSPRGKVEQINSEGVGCRCWVVWQPFVETTEAGQWVKCPCETNVGDSVSTVFSHR